MTNARRKHDSSAETAPATTRKRRAPNPNGTLRKLPSGRYQASHVVHGKRVTAPTTFRTKQDANAWLRDQAAALGQGVYRDPKAGKLTFGDYAHRWMAQRELKPRTTADYQRILDRFLIPTFGAVPLADLSPGMVNTWYAHLDKGKPTMRAHTYALLRTITKSAAAEDLIPAPGPCRVRGAGQTKRQITIRPASLDELETIANAMPPRLQAMVLLAAWCGMRYGELAELRRADVDMLRGKLVISRGVTRVKGEWVVGDPKGSVVASKREVSIPPHLLPVVAEHLDAHVGPSPDARLFLGALGGYLSPSSLYDHFYPARDAAGRPDLRFHDLRHTGAVLAAAGGATLADLMARLGHSNVSTAMRYQHMVDEDRDAAIAAVLSDFHAAKAVPLRPRAAR